MFSFINQFFAALSALFSAAEKGANALDHVATIGEEKAKAYRDEERIKIRARLAKMEAQAARDPQLVLEAE